MSEGMRVEHIRATFLYPGVFMPEYVIRPVSSPSWRDVLDAAPNESGYFTLDGWYAATVECVTSKRFESSDGDVEWVRQGQPELVDSWIIGERHHWSEIDSANGRNDILIGNIKRNDRSGGYGVHTRCGNWQLASDWKNIVHPRDVQAIEAAL